MAAAESLSKFEVFQVRPQLLESGKQSTRLARTDILSAGVQVVAEVPARRLARCMLTTS